MLQKIEIYGKYIEFNCAVCGRLVRDYASNRTKGKYRFCSRKCLRFFYRNPKSKQQKDAEYYRKNFERVRANANNYYADNKKDIIEKRRIFDRALKQEIVNVYGGKCECCGETIIEFLTIDHKKGDGAAHRREIGGKGRKLYAAIKKEGFPKDRYRLLCLNCNITLGFYGYCPHHPEIKSNVSHKPFNPGRKRSVK